MIYNYLLVLNEKIAIPHIVLKRILPEERKLYHCSSQLLRCSNQIYEDGITVLYGNNHFVATGNCASHEPDLEPQLSLFAKKIGPDATACVKSLEIQGRFGRYESRLTGLERCSARFRCLTPIQDFTGIKTILIVIPHLTILCGKNRDLMNPRTVFIDQFIYFGEFCRKLRANGPAIEIVVAVARDDEVPVVCPSFQDCSLFS